MSMPPDIDQNFRNQLIRDLAERLLFAGINSGSINQSNPVKVNAVFDFAQEIIDYGMKYYPVEDDKCQPQ